jgi:hypothetical protein
MLIIVVLATGCFFKEEAKFSGDSLLAMEAEGVIQEIRQAYEQKDQDILNRNMAPFLAAKIVNEFSFDSASLHFNFDSITIKEERLSVKVSWQSEYKIGEKTLTSQGISIFLLSGSPMKALDIQGENPFQIPEEL